jgi:hypothetical protein
MVTPPPLSILEDINLSTNTNKHHSLDGHGGTASGAYVHIKSESTSVAPFSPRKPSKSFTPG